MKEIDELWRSDSERDWRDALDRYWNYVLPRNLDLERELEGLSLDYIRDLTADAWYEFLQDRYFRWKYTAPNRYATTTRSLRSYEADKRLDELDGIRHQLLDIDTSDVAGALMIARGIKGLGTAGASGLLSLMYPDTFGTVDQFAVKALRLVDDLPEASALARMNPESLTVKDGVLLINVMRRRADDNNDQFGTDFWTTRKIDKVLWTYGR